jgi:DNA-binding CsgD family transcriptional regulator
LHRAEVLGLGGAWTDALFEAHHACDRLADPANPAALGGAWALEGDLLRLVGDFDGADVAYKRAHELGREPQPGLALLRFAEGRVDAADAMIRRVLDESEDPMTRARVLGPYVEIVLASGDTPAARAATDELRALGSYLGSRYLRAHGALARGSVFLAENNPSAALIELRSAFQEFHTLGVPYEAARTRLLLGAACAAVGDRDAAEMEVNAGRAVMESLGATAPGSVAPARAPSLPDGLTPRELEVLVLLAQGKTNRVIAQDLFISEKTVASHVSHIFTKLAVTSRSAATAYAYEHGLV